MNINIFLRTNSEEIRNKLKELGYELCFCCEFKESIWISKHIINNFFSTPLKKLHGVGHGCECDCERKSTEACCECAEKTSRKDKNCETFVVDTVEEFDKFCKAYEKKS